MKSVRNIRKSKNCIIITWTIILLLTGCKANTEGISIQKTADENRTLNFSGNFENDDTEETQKQCEKVAEDCLKYVKDIKLSNEERTEKLLSYFDEEKSSAVDFENLYDMTQHEAVENFCIDAKNNKEARIIFYRIHQDYSIEQYDVNSKDRILYLKRRLISWESNAFIITELQTYLIEEWNYTDKGYFIMNSTHPQGYDGATLDDAIRVTPLDKSLRYWNNLCILPIGYSDINMFLVDWDTSQMDKLNYLDLYPAFYKMKNREKMPDQSGDVLIPQEQYENLMKEFLPVNSIILQNENCYDKSREGYIWRNREFIESAPGESPIPEVVKAKEIATDIWELTVDAIWARKGTDKAFTHVVTIEMRESSEIHYLSNRIIPSENQQLPVYVKREY